MKKQLLIIGGGFAGFWSAISAVRESREIQKRGQVEITLVNPDNYVAIRPKPNELLSEGMHFELGKYLKPLGVHQVVGRAEVIDPEKNEVVVSTGEATRLLKYDYLILAAGASLQMPDLPGIGHVFAVDSFDNAKRLEDHIGDLAKKHFHEEGASSFVIVGAESAGLETAAGIEQKIRAIQTHHSDKKAEFRIILLENNPRFASEFPKECKQYIKDVIASKNIEVISGSELTIIGPASVLLDNGTRISARTVIWTEGLAASSLTQFFRGPKDDLNRLAVDSFLKVPGHQNVIAAGNVAHTGGDTTNSSLMDCQCGQFEGRWAGHNAINDLFNIPLKRYIHASPVTCVDLGEPKTLYATDWERNLQMERYKERAAVVYMNTVAMYPWQDIEETVKASYPEIPRFNQ